jgi:hypothetical protein
MDRTKEGIKWVVFVKPGVIRVSTPVAAAERVQRDIDTSSLVVEANCGGDFCEKRTLDLDRESFEN